MSLDEETPLSWSDGTAGAGYGFVLPKPGCMEFLNLKRLT